MFDLTNTETQVESSVVSPIIVVKKARLFCINTDQLHSGLLLHCRENLNLCNTDK